MENLLKIQTELKCAKGNLNKFGNYKYRSAEQILESVKPLLLKYESTLVLSDEILELGNKLFLKATASLFNASGSIKSIGYAEMGIHKGMSSEQCTGTASSYARKYALNGLFLIDETESDPDSKNNSEQEKHEPKKPAIDNKRFLEALKSIQQGDFTVDKLKEKFELTKEQTNAINEL